MKRSDLFDQIGFALAGLHRRKSLKLGVPGAGILHGQSFDVDEALDALADALDGACIEFDRARFFLACQPKKD